MASVSIDELFSDMDAALSIQKEASNVNSAFSFGNMAEPLDHGLSDDALLELQRLNLILNENICVFCAREGSKKPCVIEFANSFGVCEQSGQELFQASEAESNLLPYRTLPVERKANEKTALDTIITRKAFANSPCGFCRSIHQQSIAQNLIDPAQIVKSLCGHGAASAQAVGWIKQVKQAIEAGERLPLRCCNSCSVQELSLKSTCFAAYAQIPKLRERKQQAQRDAAKEEAIDTYEEYAEYQYQKSISNSEKAAWYARRKRVADEIAEYHAQHAEQTDSEGDVWDESTAVTSKELKMPHYISEIHDGFRVFDRGFHSCLLNAAVALNELLKRGHLTENEIKPLMVALFNNSRWRMEREAGVKTQLVTRLGSMPGSPLRAGFESNNTDAIQNEIGTLVVAFVEQHLHSILLPVALGQDSGHSNLEWNQLLNQQNGFYTSNQSTDALIICVYFHWKSTGFRVEADRDYHIPVLDVIDRPEAKAFFDFNFWVRETRQSERTAAERPYAEHELFRLQNGNDQALCSTRVPENLYKLVGYLFTEPEKQAYKSEPFKVALPDEQTSGNKTLRMSKVEEINAFRGNLLHRAAVDLQFYRTMDALSVDKIKEACAFLILRPRTENLPHGLRMSDYCTRLVQPPAPVTLATETATLVVGGAAPELLQIHPKQRLAGKAPVSAVALASSAAAAARLHHPFAECVRRWKAICSRIVNRMEREERASRFDVFRQVLQYKKQILGELEPPNALPLVGPAMEPVPMVRHTSLSPIHGAAVVERKSKGITKPRKPEAKPKAKAGGLTKQQKKAAALAGAKAMEAEEQAYHHPPTVVAANDAPLGAPAVMTTASAFSTIAEALIACEKRASEEARAPNAAEIKRAKAAKSDEEQELSVLPRTMQLRREHIKNLSEHRKDRGVFKPIKQVEMIADEQSSDGGGDPDDDEYWERRNTQSMSTTPRYLKEALLCKPNTKPKTKPRARSAHK